MLANQGIAKPTVWLAKTIGVRHAKVLRVLNNEYKITVLKDISEICNLLICTPND